MNAENRAGSVYHNTASAGSICEQTPLIIRPKEIPAKFLNLQISLAPSTASARVIADDFGERYIQNNGRKRQELR